MTIPNWVTELVNQVCIDYQRIDKPIINFRRTHAKKYEIITWQREKIQTFKPRPVYSSGHANQTEITITAGSSRKDQKLVILHELAHWLLPPNEDHGKAFWDLAFELYRKYKVPMYYALNREKGYRKEAVYAYRRNRNNQKTQ